MARIERNAIQLLALIVMAVTCVSCYEQTESITVAEDGSATIAFAFSGGSGDMWLPLSPSEPQWTILKHEVDTTIDDSGRVRLEVEIEASKEIPWGETWPSTYEKEGSLEAAVGLGFPTSLRMWTEQNRTYYEFERTYQPRQSACFDITTALRAHREWDDDLEKRVLEQGVFNVTEEERLKYLDQYLIAYSYYTWRTLFEGLAELALAREISLAERDSLADWTVAYLDSTVTPLRLLGILGKPSDSVAPAMDRLSDDVRAAFVDQFDVMVGPDRPRLMDLLVAALDKNTMARRVTNSLGSIEFGIALDLPGTILKTNGLYDHGSSGHAEWYINGKDLYDKSLQLYALSVVEH